MTSGRAPAAAKALFGVSPDGLRLFDLLRAAEVLRYVGELRSMPGQGIAERSAQLLGLAGSADVVVADSRPADREDRSDVMEPAEAVCG